MSKFNIDDELFVPAAKVPNLRPQPTTFYKSRVIDVSTRTVRIGMPGGHVSEWIGSGLCHKNVGILILTVGDDNSESTLLDPLSKTLLQYCRLLVSDDYLRSFKVRSLDEFVHLWQTHQELYSCVVLIGHGSSEGLEFLVDGTVSSGTLGDRIRVYGASKKTFISLACETGRKAFAAPLSKKAICREFIAPFHSVHGAIASQFVQTFLANHFLVGCSTKVAFKAARTATPEGTSFRLWKNGSLAQS